MDEKEIEDQIIYLAMTEGNDGMLKFMQWMYEDTFCNRLYDSMDALSEDEKYELLYELEG